jgi:hypothetical protein
LAVVVDTQRDTSNLTFVLQMNRIDSVLRRVSVLSRSRHLQAGDPNESDSDGSEKSTEGA